MTVKNLMELADEYAMSRTKYGVFADEVGETRDALKAALEQPVQEHGGLDDETRLGWAFWRIKDLEQKLASLQTYQARQSAVEPAGQFMQALDIHGKKVWIQIDYDDFSVGQPLYTAPQSVDSACSKDHQGCWNVRCQLVKKCVNHTVDPMRRYVEDFASKCGWNKDSGEGAFEFVQRASYAQGIEDGRNCLADKETPAVDPVARFNWRLGGSEWLTKYDYDKHNMKPLYLGTPQAQQPQLLTDDEIWNDDELISGNAIAGLMLTDYAAVVRIIETVVLKKNGLS